MTFTRRVRRLALFALCTYSTACGAGTPSAPSLATGTKSVTVAGASSVSVGQSVQLRAFDGAGQDITVGATWQTSDTTVARVSATGIVLGVAHGAVVIKATYLGTTGALDVAVSPVLIATPSIASCGEIVAPGSYVVASDVAQPVFVGPCLSITSSGVDLDCSGHAVSGVRVSGVSDVTVHNCTLNGYTARITHASNVTFHHNRMSSITLDGGGSNTVRDNTIDGGYDGSGGLVGEDDGVILEDETSDVVINNDIRNVFDAGIEGIDAVRNTVIANNTIDNTGSVGIGAYWCTAWTGNIIRDNVVSQTPGLVRFIYGVHPTKCGVTSTVGEFRDNQFISNRYIRPLAIQQTDGSMLFSFPTLGAGQVSNNTLLGNDMGLTAGPSLNPLSGFRNLGGNICAPGTSPFC